MADQELQSVACKPIPNIEGVFLVNLQHDYVYGCAIECAFFRREAEFWRESLRKFGNRRKITRACPGDHVKSDKLCAMEWILYVDQTSEFFHYCSRQLKQQNPMIEHTNHYINAERLSFYLVLFLCGEYIQPLQEFNELGLDEKASHFSSAYYANINQWKKLPLWFLDVWYAGHPKSI